MSHTECEPGKANKGFAIGGTDGVIESRSLGNRESLLQVSSISQAPKVSIGLPVYNGANYIAEALESLLLQSFDDFELIISDNGSTDATSVICSKYARQDPRIRYHRIDTNHGAAWNFNHVFDLTTGEYFMWAAHDDVWAPEFLQRCVSVLDNNPDAVLCYAETKVISPEGDRVLKEFAVNPELSSRRAYRRFSAGWRYPSQIPVFGLIRRVVLEKTQLIGSFSASDQVLVGELTMRGPFIGVPESLFSYRRHRAQSTASPYPTMRSRMAWFDPKNPIRLTFPHWRLLIEHFSRIRHSPAVTIERLLCGLSLLRWMVRYRKRLLKDLILRDSWPRNSGQETS